MREGALPDSLIDGLGTCLITQAAFPHRTVQVIPFLISCSFCSRTSTSNFWIYFQYYTDGCLPGFEHRATNISDLRQFTYMGSQEVSGKTEEQLETMRAEHEHLYLSFEERYCLSRIPRQPEEYDGPQRYCSSTNVKKNGRCKHHGGCTTPHPENLDKLASMKHGMYARDDHLRETMSEREEELYEWVLSWPDKYNIDLTEDPSAAHDFQTLAIEIVREARGKDYILRNSEIREKGVYLPDGTMVEQEELPNTLNEAMASQVRLIQKVKDSLGLTRKQQAKNDQVKNASEIMDGLAGAMTSMVDSNEEYDPSAFDGDDGGE